MFKILMSSPLILIFLSVTSVVSLTDICLFLSPCLATSFMGTSLALLLSGLLSGFSKQKKQGS